MAFGSTVEHRQLGRMHQPDVAEGSPAPENVDVGMAQPDPFQVSVGACGLDDRLGRRLVLDVDRQLEIDAAGAVELGQGGDVVGDVGPSEPADGAPEGTATDLPVVVQHHGAVGAQPGVGLEAPSAQPTGQNERLDRVVAGVGSCPTVSEADRGATEGIDPAGHRTIVPGASRGRKAAGGSRFLQENGPFGPSRGSRSLPIQLQTSGKGRSRRWRPFVRAAPHAAMWSSRRQTFESGCASTTTEASTASVARSAP